MSVAPSQSQINAFGYFGLRMGADDFLGLGQTRERYELIHGVVCMSPRPNTLHQRILSLIQFQMEIFTREHPGFRYLPDVDLVLDDETVYAPDLVCYRPGRITGFPLRLDSPPDLVVEILSHGTKAFDLTTKRADYEKFGVQEYWCYDPAEGEPRGALRCFRRAGAGFLDVPASGDTFACAALPGFTLDFRPLRTP